MTLKLEVAQDHTISYWIRSGNKPGDGELRPAIKATVDLEFEHLTFLVADA